jgi:hypothetical protein
MFFKIVVHVFWNEQRMYKMINPDFSGRTVIKIKPNLYSTNLSQRKEASGFYYNTRSWQNQRFP